MNKFEKNLFSITVLAMSLLLIIASPSGKFLFVGLIGISSSLSLFISNTSNLQKYYWLGIKLLWLQYIAFSWVVLLKMFEVDFGLGLFFVATLGFGGWVLKITVKFAETE